MKTFNNYLLLVASMLFSSICLGQRGPEPEKAGRMEDGRFVLTINPGWDEAQRSRFATLFNLDSVLITAIFNQQFTFVNDSSDWNIQINSAGLPELSKVIGQQSENMLDKIILSGIADISASTPSYSLPATFGLNDLSDIRAFSYTSGTACFFLPGYPGASQVFLSGSFNQWSTMQLPMQRNANGWSVCLELLPGKYHYKYIVDGRWIQDPGNRLTEKQGRGTQNSVVYCYNFSFYLDGHSDARRVNLAGSFNNWNPRELFMKKTPEGWELPVYLKEGTHAYKFIVDGRWITDPANPVTRPDGRGNENSFLAIGDTIIFRLNGYHDAQRVMLAGSFNAWNPAELEMYRTENGWELPYVLAHGNYEYKFIADGRWMTDPDNPYTIGEGNFTNSFLAYKPNHLFVLRGYDAQQNVIVTGSFNRWNHSGYRMGYIGGQWVLPIYLEPGRHSYKFIVNGNWMMDPDNPLWEQNEYRGDGNSVLWVE